MEPTPELIKQLRREEIESARQMTFEQRFLAGAELFDYAREIAMGSIREMNPHLTEDDVQAEFRRRLDIADRIENRT
jgi:hypothetical protein